MTGNLFLYGANGYTGRLILEYAERYGLSPILAGRNETAIRELSGQYDLPYRTGSLTNADEMDNLLKDVSVVLHVAGPFSETARPMVEACLRNSIHYLDITGEIPVFEYARSLDGKARGAGIMVMPGTGFDVVPTDCMAKRLRDQLSDATHLELAFTSIGGGISHGTATTMARSLGEGGAIRSNGKIISDPLGNHSRHIDFGKGPQLVMSIPWGDVSTAYHTTGIPNIIVYTGIPPRIHQILKLQKLYNWALRTGWARKKAQQWIDKKPAGPSPETRSNSRSYVWGQVRNSQGSSSTAMLTCADGYTLTAHSSLIIAKKVLDGNFSPGYQTPAGCYGSGLIDEIPGSAWL